MRDDLPLLDSTKEHPLLAVAADSEIAFAGPPPPHTFCCRAMGTEFTLHLYTVSQDVAPWIAESAFEEVARVENLLSHYRASSELSRINREAVVTAVTTDPETFRFLEYAFAWSAHTDGAFDMTVGKLMKTWGFFGDSGRVPTEEELLQVRSAIGWQHVQLDVESRTVRFLAPDIELDPGGIGKGYAVDCVVRLLQEEKSITAALLSAGSSTLYAIGAPPGEAGWKVHVPAPGHPEQIVSTIELRDTSLSTANHSEKYFLANGRRYGSIMDPATLQPVDAVSHVTVIAPSATDSDILSNALFVLPADARSALLGSLPPVSSLVLTGAQEKLLCEATRWPAEIASRFDSLQTTIKEN